MIQSINVSNIVFWLTEKVSNYFRSNVIPIIDGDEPHNGNVTREIVLKYIKEINHKLEMVEQKLMPIEVETDVPEKEFIVFTNTTHSAAFK